MADSSVTALASLAVCVLAILALCLAYPFVENEEE